MEEVTLDNERKHHYRVVFEDKRGGIDDEKALLHAKIWYLYMCNKILLIRDCYYVEVSGYDGKKVFCEVADNHVIEDSKENGEI